MLGLLLRILPFWVREPLLIVVGAVFGVRIAYLAVHDEEPVAAGIALVFLVFTAVRVRTVVRALRARRKPEPVDGGGGGDSAGGGDGAGGEDRTDRAAGRDGVAASAAHRPEPQAAPAAPAAPVAPAVPEKEPNAWGQAVAAVAVFAAIGFALWFGPRILPSEDAAPANGVSCPDLEEEPPSAYRDTPGAVTGDVLCRALNRPDLAGLLRTPGETATAASGDNGTAPLTDGKVAQPEAEVTFDTYTVNVSATYNDLTIAQYVKLLETGGQRDHRPLSVLGRPAVFSSDHTMRISIDLANGASGGPVEQGPLARTLTVALDREDRGGSYDITVWSESGGLPEDGVLLGIAEEVLPAVAGPAG
ncbi:DUF6215 domain-containing protein [Streptomyces sp. VITNK9]|uniref:DUF6215 domain-containing protein n=1 Tax=Streptomyces sp. VITNK9 TaxID=2771292 RepID=UPI0017828FE2|nr:DUF6215 domain-containing protein [Streptomyces sp. VITNK9]